MAEAPPLIKDNVASNGKTERHELSYGPAYVYFYIDHKEKLVDIAVLRVPGKAGKQGWGRRALRYVLSIADKLHYRTTLLASPLTKRTNLGKLVHFYESEGFTPTGRLSSVAHPYMSRAERDKVRRR